jgi:methyltransferase-like protein
MINPVYKQNKEVIFRQEQDEAILFNPGNSNIIVINPTGCFIWALCNGKNSEKDIIDSMLEEFDTTAKRAQEDLSRFLSELERREFVERIK